MERRTGFAFRMGRALAQDLAFAAMVLFESVLDLTASYVRASRRSGR